MQYLGINIMQTTQQRNSNGSDGKQAGTSSSTGSAQNSEVLSQPQGKGPDVPQTDLGAADSGDPLLQTWLVDY